jgi:isopentenyl phosphate kinase
LQTDLRASTETAAHDVTGGIQAKLQVGIPVIHL